MRLFDWFKKKKAPAGKEIEKSGAVIKQLWDTDIRDIWDITDVSQFLGAMNGWICKKCHYGSHLELLSDQEQTFFFTIQLQAEVDNGGFIQYFHNAYDITPAYLVPSFIAIKAEKTAAICKKALDALGDNIPSGQMEREEFLERVVTDEVGNILCECDDEFYDVTDKSENLDLLNYQFILKNKLYFT